MNLAIEQIFDRFIDNQKTNISNGITPGGGRGYSLIWPIRGCAAAGFWPLFSKQGM